MTQWWWPRTRTTSPPDQSILCQSMVVFRILHEPRGETAVIVLMVIARANIFIVIVFASLLLNRQTAEVIIRGGEQLFWGGDQFPIPTRYKISVWGGDQSPPPHVKFPAWGGTSPPSPPPPAPVGKWLYFIITFKRFPTNLMLRLKNCWIHKWIKIISMQILVYIF